MRPAVARLITVEGIDGAGKTTLVVSLANALKERGVSVRILREPGGVALSEKVRELVADPSLEIDARAEALLFAAARAQLCAELLAPLLEQDEWVLLDRFVDSSLAYQGSGRQLGISEVAEINRFGTGGLTPDRTLLLTIDAATGAARRSGEDRIEQESSKFFERVASGYDSIASAEPDRVRVIDGNLTPEEVLSSALAALEDLLPSGVNDLAATVQK